MEAKNEKKQKKNFFSYSSVTFYAIFEIKITQHNRMISLYSSSPNDIYLLL